MLLDDISIKHICLSQTTSATIDDYEAIIVDSVGILLDLYKYADIAYVGAGFSHGVHSVIEPLAQNCVVCYGPEIDILDEAVEITSTCIGHVINNSDDADDQTIKQNQFTDRALHQFESNFDITNEIKTATGVEFNPSGTKMYVVGITPNASIGQYSLTVPFDISTTPTLEEDVAIQADNAAIQSDADKAALILEAAAIT